MAKTKHIHVIEATAICALPFDPQNLSGAAAIQTQLEEAAAKLVGFRSVTTRMTKVPVTAVAPAATNEMPPIPTALRAK